jgi:mRNA-degrading endonuclease RelE of RelBE toxin-antitoxin system
MPYEILVHEGADEELEALRVFDQRQIIDAIEEHLSYQPTLPTRRRKLLEALTPTFEHVPPVWELRVGQFRVFYDVDEATKRVHIRAVRRKASGQTTEDIA